MFGPHARQNQYHEVMSYHKQGQTPVELFKGCQEHVLNIEVQHETGVEMVHTKVCTYTGFQRLMADNKFLETINMSCDTVIHKGGYFSQRTGTVKQNIVNLGSNSEKYTSDKMKAKEEEVNNQVWYRMFINNLNIEIHGGFKHRHKKIHQWLKGNIPRNGWGFSYVCSEFTKQKYFHWYVLWKKQHVFCT